MYGWTPEENATPDYVEAEDQASADDLNDCDTNAPEDASEYDGVCPNEEEYAHADRDEIFYIEDNPDHGHNDYDEHTGEDIDYGGHAPEDQVDYGPKPHYEDDSHYNEQKDNDYQDDN